jgi:hypothetical protein
MRTWTADEVAAADEAWEYVPPHSLEVASPEFTAFVIPGSYSMNFMRRFHCAPERVDSAIDEALERIRAAGATGMRWAVRPTSTPEDLGTRLLGHGFTKIVAAETLFLGLGTLADPHLPGARAHATISIREASTDAEFEAFRRLGEVVFGDPPPPPQVAEGFRTSFAISSTRPVVPAISSHTMGRRRSAGAG